MSTTVYYDRWGGYQGTNPAPPTEKLAYIVETSGNTTYICYTPDDENGKRVVERNTKSTSGGATTTTVEHAYGAWASRATLTYYPINEAIPVEV